MKILFVIGPTGVGKSTFIEQEYAGKKNICIFNIARKAKELYGSFKAMDNEDCELNAINKSCSEAFFALMDEKTVVVEYHADGFDDGLFALIKKARSLCIPTEIIALTVEVGEALERVSHAGLDYFPSVKMKEDTELVFMGVLEDVEFNLDFERICEIGAEGGSINFYRFKKEDGERFFFLTDESGFFDFEPSYEIDKKEGVTYLEEFPDFDSAFEKLLEKYPIFRLFPVEVNPKFKGKFRAAFQHFLSLEPSNEANPFWNESLN